MFFFLWPGVNWLGCAFWFALDFGKYTLRSFGEIDGPCLDSRFFCLHSEVDEVTQKIPFKRSFVVKSNSFVSRPFWNWVPDLIWFQIIWYRLNQIEIMSFCERNSPFVKQIFHLFIKQLYTHTRSWQQTAHSNNVGARLFTTAQNVKKCEIWPQVQFST